MSEVHERAFRSMIAAYEAGDRDAMSTAARLQRRVLVVAMGEVPPPKLDVSTGR